MDLNIDHWIILKRSKLFDVVFLPCESSALKYKLESEAVETCGLAEDEHGYTLVGEIGTFVLGLGHIRNKNSTLHELLHRDYLPMMDKLLDYDSMFNIVVASDIRSKNASYIKTTDNIDSHLEGISKVRAILKHRGIYWDRNTWPDRKRVLIRKGIFENFDGIKDLYDITNERYRESFRSNLPRT